MDSVFELLKERTETLKGGPTVEDANRRLGLPELTAEVHRYAGRLQRAGVQAGDRILIARTNSVDWVISTLAVMRLGAIAALINPQATAREVGIYEGIIAPRGAIAEKGGEASRFGALLPLNDAADRDASEGDLPPLPKGSDRALILFTSGTTGFPKAAVQSHRMLIHSGQGFVHWMGLSPQDRLLIAMPLFHANGIYYSLMGGLFGGCDMVIAPRFSASGFWTTVREARATEVNLMGPLLSMILKQPQRPEERGHCLRTVYTAAAPREVLARFAKRFQVEVIEGYGMTETSYGCINPRNAPRAGSIGKPRQHPTGAIANEIKIADNAGRALPTGETGEIMIRNGATTLEYWNNPEATSAALCDGWLRTGDLGYCDADGYFFIVGRIKEMIRRKGVNIAPREIELELARLPGIEEAAVVGLPSPLGEEMVIAVVTLASDVPVDDIEHRIAAQLAHVLSREKLPDEIVVARELPKTPTQRVEKAKVREWLQQRPQKAG